MKKKILFFILLFLPLFTMAKNSVWWSNFSCFRYYQNGWTKWYTNKKLVCLKVKGSNFILEYPIKITLHCYNSEFTVYKNTKAIKYDCTDDDGTYWVGYFLEMNNYYRYYFFRNKVQFLYIINNGVNYY
jgi:hypothetical protein